MTPRNVHSADTKKKQSLIFPASVQPLLNLEYITSATNSYIFDDTHITTIIKFTNKTKRLLDPENIDNTAVS